MPSFNDQISAVATRPPRNVHTLEVAIIRYLQYDRFLKEIHLARLLTNFVRHCVGRSKVPHRVYWGERERAPHMLVEVVRACIRTYVRTYVRFLYHIYRMCKLSIACKTGKYDVIYIHHKEQTGRIYMSCTTPSIGTPCLKSVSSYKHSQ